MQISDVIALSHAGFTADQIMQMAQVQQQAPAPQQIQQPVQVPQQIPQPQMMQPVISPQQMAAIQPPAPAPAPTPAPAPAPAPDPKPDPFQQLFEQMTGIKQAIQSSNIQNSQIAGGAPQSTDDILASIIQPTKPKED